MLRITELTLDGCLLRDAARYRLSDRRFPVFGWKVSSDRDNDATRRVRVELSSQSGVIWDSGFVAPENERLKYGGPALPAFTELYINVELESVSGESDSMTEWFYCFPDGPDLEWITAPGAEKRRPVVFRKTFTLSGIPEEAMALYCCLGYGVMYVNGIRIDDARLDTAFTDFSRSCHYVFQEGFASLLREGENTVEYIVADGWRNFDSPFITETMGFPRPRFDGPVCLSATIRLGYGGDGDISFDADDSWSWNYCNIVSSSVYDGEIYDARSVPDGGGSAVFLKRPCLREKLMLIPPVTEHETYVPRDIIRKNGGYVLDFGQNIAGVIRLRLPDRTVPGQRIEIRYAEILDESFDIYTAPLREAKATDVYICSGDESGGEYWQPEFTYHGFRYAFVSGIGLPLSPEDAVAVSLYTDVLPAGDFLCGSAALNAMHRMFVMTEKANIHSVFTDCPQRDERMGWMNDATVRFEEIPYNFEIGRMYPKVVDDVCESQDEQGRITCTAPFVIGARPADPVCSAFLIAGYEYVKRTGDVSFVAAHYDFWRRWEEYLLSRSDGFIVGYTYYGDWAGPAGSCVSQEDARSSATPGILMSTGYSYLNCVILAYFASMLGLGGGAGKWKKTASAIRKAFLDRWYDPATGKIAGGSQGSQVFALKLGLVPEEGRQAVFDVLAAGITANGMKFTTGNLNTRYLFEILAEFGRVDLAYGMLKDERYPGFGYMLENGATTAWERFELKKNPDMNSHNHPMYAASDRWFYAYILGIGIPDEAAPGEPLYTVRPYMPEGLLSAQGYTETQTGRLCVRWKKTYGSVQLSVTVPYGASCEIFFGGNNIKVGSGEYMFNSDL